MLEADEEIEKKHTSCFVDINGDHKADLVLIIKKGNDERYLKVLESSVNGFQKSFEFKLPKETSPIIFNDLIRNGMNGMVFISKENEEYFLNFYINKNQRSNLYEYKSDSKSVIFENVDSNFSQMKTSFL